MLFIACLDDKIIQEKGMSKASILETWYEILIRKLKMVIFQEPLR